MSIHWQILGQPGADNALYVTVDSGQSRSHLLFDCGEKCLDDLEISQIKSVEQLCFSHYHMDHVCGFDTFFRHNYNREAPAMSVWGPAGTIDLMHHRFRGFTWNLHSDQPGMWQVHEFSDDSIQSAYFRTAEAFAEKHPLPNQRVDPSPPHVKTTDYSLRAWRLPHGSIDSLAWRIDESPKENIDPKALAELGIRPGPWLQTVTDSSREADAAIQIDGRDYKIEALRSQLLVTTPGASLCYLTDFAIEPETEAWETLVASLRGVDTLCCESQYLSRDRTLARRNGHMTAALVGQLASDADVGQLILHHLSRRYSHEEWLEMKNEAATTFPATSFPPNWAL